ncbi:putative serpin-Z5 [Lolium perenne]|uniref:putative serpin-Z5 n=1 Tax=Lolium perenne TaxID=4522 RepID=UPI0021F5C44E|nr:putative serpin-Z5 [Lolium perenne]
MSESARSGLQAFALALNKRLAGDAARSNRNLIFSPVSVYAALSLVTAGARERTLSELLGVLGAVSRDDLAGSVRVLSEQALADQSQTGGPRVSFACALWHDKTRPLKPAYIDAAVKSYKARTCSVDFHKKPGEAAKRINAWVRASTNDLITEIIDPSQLCPRTDLVLANAIYFKGKWRQPFNEEYTEEDEFHRLDGSTVEVSFMQDDSRRQRIACHRGFKVLQLDYEEGRKPQALYSMCVFLPNTRKGLPRLTDRIAADPDFVRKHLPTVTVAVGEFRLPKFKLNFSTGMNGVLPDLGIKEAFQEGKADFYDMVADDDPVRRLNLQEVLHKAVIEVNEEGTEAAAVTACRMQKVTCQVNKLPKLVDFVADHPFAFFVIEEVSGAILYAGYVLDPSSE